jgi:hypothetical protein
MFPKPPKGVDDAPGVAAALPNRPPLGLLAGVLDAPPPKRLDPPVLLPAPPNRPLLLGALDVLPVAPKSEGVLEPVEAGAPKRFGFGVLLLLLLLPCWPNEKPDILAGI